MPLAPGDKLGPYEVLSPIGAGGNGLIVPWPSGTPRGLRLEPGMAT
jgi:hypothetical protein